jgi:hypothetical protein
MQETTPSGDSTEVPNRPSQRARIRFLLKSSAVEFSDHCTPMPGVGVHDDRVGGQDVTHSSGRREQGGDGARSQGRDSGAAGSAGLVDEVLAPQLCAGRSLLPRTPFVARAEMRVGVAVTRPSSFYIIDLVP